MAERFDLVVVGMGSAGVVATEFAASLGLGVCAVERDRVGGDCLWTGCVPSKALLAAARAAHAMRTADRFGLAPVEPAIDTARVLARVRAVQEQIASSDDDPDRFRAMGVNVRVGEPARLEGPHHVRVGADVIEARFVLLCPGSRPAVPPIDGLGEAGFVTSETLWDLERLPASALLVGGGPIAVELAQALRRLGSEVTILGRAGRLLVRDEPELAERLAAVLRAEGVRIELGVAPDRASLAGDRKALHAGERSWTGEEIVVAVGRRTAVEGLGLDAIGVAPGASGTIEVDDRSRTRASSVYAVGDATGGEQFTHAAAADAARAVRDMFFPGRGRSRAIVPWCTFTDPELAHAGLTSAEARARRGAGDVEVHTIELAHSDRARAEAAAEGALVAVTRKGRLVGAHLLAPAAGEVVGELTLAIEHGLKLADLASVVHVYPTVATSVAQLSARAAFGRARRYRRLIRGV